MARSRRAQTLGWVSIFDIPIISTQEAATPAIVDEEKKHKYAYKHLELDSIVSSKCGRFLLINWTDDAERYKNTDTLALVDTYSNERILFKRYNVIDEPWQAYKVVALCSGNCCVMYINNQLMWFRLDIATKKVEPLYQMEVLDDGFAFPLDPNGRNFIVSNEYETQIIELEEEIVKKTDSPKCRIRTFPTEVYFSRLYAAQLSKSGQCVWMIALNAIWKVQLSDLTIHRYVVDKDSRLGLLLANRTDINPFQFFDGEYMVAIASGRTNQPKQCATRLFLIRLNEETGAELLSEWSLEPDRRWQCFSALIGDQSSLRIALNRTVAQIHARRPESLLATAHMAAIKSKQQFELPTVTPINSLSGRQPKYAAPKPKRRRIQK